MKCTTCGYETQAGAKFCVQCGTTIVTTSAPAGMAPLAQPSVTPRPPSAPPVASPSATAARPAYTSPPSSSAAPGMPPMAPPTTSSSLPLGLIAGLLALIAVLGIGSFVAYKMLFPPAEPKEPVVATQPNKSNDSAPAQRTADAPKDGAASTNTTTGSSPTGTMSAPQVPASAATTDSAATTAAKAPETPKAAAGTPVAPKTATATTKAGAAAGKSDSPMPTAPIAAPAPSPARQAAAPAVAPAPQPDRWELMRQAYAVCSREALFERLACNQRVGQQYCKGYWGQVAQCPAGAYGDRAN